MKASHSRFQNLATQFLSIAAHGDTHCSEVSGGVFVTTQTTLTATATGAEHVLSDCELCFTTIDIVLTFGIYNLKKKTVTNFCMAHNPILRKLCSEKYIYLQIQ